MVSVDAVVVGAGPNGLTAAVMLARRGLAVRVYEAADTVGGGARTQELTLPGFRHDPCSAVHPLGAGSPVLAGLPLHRHGLRWLHPPVPLAHPFPDGSAAVLDRSVELTAAGLGADARAYRRLMAPFAGRWAELAADLLRPPLAGWPGQPALLARFAARCALPMAALSRGFREQATRALLAGIAAHTMVPLTSPATSAVGLLLALAGHEVGWPVPAGGSQAISDALAGYLTELGGEIVTGHPVRSWADLPPARAVLFDTSPAALARIAGDRLPARYVAALRRYRYGPGVFKIDYALAGPMPWAAAAARQAGTVHLGPHYRDIAAALRATRHGAAPDPPFLIVAQPSVADPARAPAGRHVLWVYGHVPNGWPGDAAVGPLSGEASTVGHLSGEASTVGHLSGQASTVGHLSGEASTVGPLSGQASTVGHLSGEARTAAIEAQLDRFAPGFRDLVLARHVAGPAAIEAANPNYVGGDIGCGSFAGLQALARPVPRRLPCATPNPGIYLCSAATPPGPGVHGMCGFHAARSVLDGHRS